MNIIAKNGKVGETEVVRNRFFSKKRMLADDFQIEQDYFVNGERLINRAILGWGVVYGFEIEGATLPGPCGFGEEVKEEPPSEPQPAKKIPVASESSSAKTSSGETGQATVQETFQTPEQAQGAIPDTPVPPAPFPLEIGPGFALDRGGRHVQLRSPTKVTAENTMLLVEKDSGWIAADIEKLEPGGYILAAHYAEYKAGGSVPASLCCCDETERTHLREGIVFSLRRRYCRCGEPDRAPDGLCVCDACDPGGRGSHARLVAWATGHKDHPPSHLCDWHGVMVARGDPVDLACVTVAEGGDKCSPISVTDVDASSPRRLIKTNDTLFDLLNGCDLTVIEEISWHDWHRSKEKVPWKMFADYFTSDPGPGSGLLTHFTVRFSGPVQAASIRRDVIAITVQMADGGTGWIRSRRLPLRDPDVTPSTTTLPPGTTDQFRVTVDRRWVRDEIEKEGETYLSERDFVVEIEIRGDLIVDCSGQPVDANATGLTATPSGNGTPGGSYFSTFMVKHMERPAAPDE